MSIVLWQLAQVLQHLDHTPVDESEWRFDKDFFSIYLRIYSEQLTVGLHVLFYLQNLHLLLPLLFFLSLLDWINLGLLLVLIQLWFVQHNLLLLLEILDIVDRVFWFINVPNPLQFLIYALETFLYSVWFKFSSRLEVVECV